MPGFLHVTDVTGERVPGTKTGYLNQASRIAQISNSQTDLLEVEQSQTSMHCLDDLIGILRLHPRASARRDRTLRAE